MIERNLKEGKYIVSTYTETMNRRERGKGKEESHLKMLSVA
jgi:hypothetical protein